MPRRQLSIKQARRIALAAQGLDKQRTSGKIDVRHVRGVIRRLGLVQLDYVNVLVPAHYQVLFSRLGPYDRRSLDEVVYRRREFTEQWAHEASIVPMESWALLEHRRRDHRVRPWGFEKLLARYSDFVDSVLDEFRKRGALTADALAAPEGALQRMGDTWGWVRGFKRQVLEAHFGFGRLAVADRLPNFQRVYDLPERVVPNAQMRLELTREEQQRALLMSAARAHGVGWATDLADYYRMPVRETRLRLAELLEAGELQRVDVEGHNEAAFLHPEARLPRAVRAETLLSPFDPLIWTRRRARRLFDFDYRIEIFVPEPKRRWGYYVLPFLWRDELVARVDLKADRKQKTLEVRAAYLEPQASADDVAPSLAHELAQWAGWLALDRVRVKTKGGLSAPLREAVAG